MTTTYSAPDIMCDGCATSIKNALGKQPGISSVDVNVDAKTVTVTHDAPSDAVVAALDRAGFTATPVEA